jgi:hypothetical protein
MQPHAPGRSAAAWLGEPSALHGAASAQARGHDLQPPCSAAQPWPCPSAAWGPPLAGSRSSAAPGPARFGCARPACPSWPSRPWPSQSAWSGRPACGTSAPCQCCLFLEAEDCHTCSPAHGKHQQRPWDPPDHPKHASWSASRTHPPPATAHVMPRERCMKCYVLAAAAGQSLLRRSLPWMPARTPQLVRAPPPTTPRPRHPPHHSPGTHHTTAPPPTTYSWSR